MNKNAKYEDIIRQGAINILKVAADEIEKKEDPEEEKETKKEQQEEDDSECSEEPDESDESEEMDPVQEKIAMMLGYDVPRKSGLSKTAASTLGIDSKNASLAKNYLDYAFAIEKEAQDVLDEVDLIKAAAISVLAESGAIEADDIEKIASMSTDEYYGC